jgi:hypothetical protein
MIIHNLSEFIFYKLFDFQFAKANFNKETNFYLCISDQKIIRQVLLALAK